MDSRSHNASQQRNQLNLLDDDGSLRLAPFPEAPSVRSSAPRARASAFGDDVLHRDASIFPNSKQDFSSFRPISFGSTPVSGKLEFTEYMPMKLDFPSPASHLVPQFSEMSISPQPSYQPAAAPPKSRVVFDDEFQQMLNSAPSIMMDLDEPLPLPSSGDDGIADLPDTYERASSVSCQTDLDKLFSTLRQTMINLRCDFNDSTPSQITGCAYYHTASVDFRVNTYRNPACHGSTLTVEVQRISGRASAFSRLVDDIVGGLCKAGVLSGCSEEYPQGQMNCGSPMELGELSVPGSSVSSSQRGATANCGDDEFEESIPMRPALALSSSLSGPAPPIPRFPSRPASFSASHHPRRAMDLVLSKDCLMNLLEPFRCAGTTLKEKRAAAITLARACDNKEGRSGLLEPEILKVLEDLLRSKDKELTRCATIILCRLFEWSELSQEKVIMLWDRFHPVIVRHREQMQRFESPELDRYIARMLAASLSSGMSCGELRARLSRSPHREDLSRYLMSMAQHVCTQVQSHSKRALNVLKAVEGAKSLADCARC